jgi:hypothetical protein
MGVVMERWCPTQQMLGVFLRRILVKKLLLIGTVVLLTATSANAGPEAEHRGHWVSSGQWQMNDIGRNHGVLGGPGIPKCNPWVSPECARLHPSLFKKVPQPRSER